MRGVVTFLLLFVGLGLTLSVSAQTYTLKSFDMKVSGTSNLHDWTMKASGAKVNAAFTLKANSPLVIASLNTLDFSIPVKGLKSEHDLMDSRAYSTLKEEKYPSISFKMTSADITPQAGNKYAIKATGSLTIAGVAKEVVLNTVGILNADKSISVTGSQKIKFSNWNVKAPSFMLGALKVGDEVTVDYSLKLAD